MLQFRKSQRIGMSAFSVVRGRKADLTANTVYSPASEGQFVSATPRRKESDESKFLRWRCADTTVLPLYCAMNQVRSRTAGADRHDYLWASCRGRALGGHSIHSAVRRRIRKALSFPINLHRFRRAAGTFGR
jgi:hypothetical protein